MGRVCSAQTAWRNVTARVPGTHQMRGAPTTREQLSTRADLTHPSPVAASLTGAPPPPPHTHAARGGQAACLNLLLTHAAGGTLSWQPGDQSLHQLVNQADAFGLTGERPGSSVP
jgi:hypothetical protein